MRRYALALASSVAIHACLFAFAPTMEPLNAPRHIHVSFRALPAKNAQKAAKDTSTQKNEIKTTAQNTSAPTEQEKRVAAAPPKTPPRPTEKTQTRPKPQTQPKTQEPPQTTTAQPQPARPSPQPQTQPAETVSSAGGETATAETKTNDVASGTVDVSSLLVTKKIVPNYPALSKKRREEGTVIVIAVIEGGRVAHAEIERSSGHAPLDEAALDAARGWRFDAAGTSSSIRARIPFKFSLR